MPQIATAKWQSTTVWEIEEKRINQTGNLTQVVDYAYLGRAT